MLITIKVFATVVMVNAIMKQQNIIPHMTPDKSPIHPSENSDATALLFCCHKSTPATNKAANTLRQNVTSNPRAASSWRVMTPAMLHKVAAQTIKSIARV